ncbi:FAD-dependent oxidoreductase [Cellulomonas timonensis]|uniref:FAD-dependent oxidoreductase n=1 Tax=Cellulomonas timonensis TaxID=1689271 RepID=UPI0008363516|nr:FAD-dependent oxidoreductase [Cellulomonas timonensis]
MVARTSLWLDRLDARALATDGGAGPSAELADPHDVVVVGAGLTGLTTALLLARAGWSVVVVESRWVGAGTTGRSTAKVSLLQGTRLSSMARRHPEPVQESYLEGSREGMDWLLRYCDEHGVAYQRRPAVTYATTGPGLVRVDEEMRVAERLGLPVEWRDELELPVAVVGAVELADQAQLDPMDVLAALAEDVVARGGRIVDRARVLGAHREPAGTYVVRTTRGDTRADTVVLATGAPVLDRGGFFGRLQARRSYALACQAPGDLPPGMYLSSDGDTRSVRSTPVVAAGESTADAGAMLLVGGAGHVTGRGGPTGAHVRRLTRWTERHFPGAVVTHAWSAQDYASSDGLPLVGRLVPTNGRVLFASGYDKWGMTTAVAAALVMAAELLGDHPPRWAADWRPWRPRELVRGAGTVARWNAEVGVRLASDWLRPWPAVAERPTPPEGQGRIERARFRHPEAVCTVGGVTRRVSGVCTHLGGIVTWNDAERSWDCPLHGSRFDATGSPLEGPATKPLEPTEPAQPPRRRQVPGMDAPSPTPAD